MKSFDFAQAPQEVLAQVSAAGQNALDASHKLFTAQVGLAQDNAEQAFGLARTAFGVRTVEDAKSFWAEAARATRESFERTTRFAQDLASQQVQAAQDLGNKVSASAAKKR